MKRGVVCATDRSQEWLLRWWWERYRECNDFPVAFVDLGMSEAGKKWCAQRGELIECEIDPSFLLPKSAVPDAVAREWEALYGSEVWQVWELRAKWFMKPFALLRSPFEKAIWIDLDCEVLGSLEPLFSCCSPLGLVRQYQTAHLPIHHPEARYNGGVIAFERGAPIVKKWAEQSIECNHLFLGDDQLLSHLINMERLEVVELDEIYNCIPGSGLNFNAVIVHWIGAGGKAYIKSHGGLKPSLDLLNGVR